MINSKFGSLPTSKFIYVDSRFTHRKPCGWQYAHWVQIVSKPGLAWGINVIFENGGMMYRSIPPWAIAFDKDAAKIMPHDTQMWNCYSDQFVIHECPHLAGMRCTVQTKSRKIKGEYLFQTSHMNDSFSQVPEQDKTMIWVKTDEGRLTIFPNNRVYFHDPCFNTQVEPQPLKLHTTEWMVDEEISTAK